MHDNACVLTKCIAVSSRHLDNISHPLCFALTRTGRARRTKIRERSPCASILMTAAFQPEVLSRVFIKFTARSKTTNHNDDVTVAPYALIVNVIIM